MDLCIQLSEPTYARLCLLSISPKNLKANTCTYATIQITTMTWFMVLSELRGES